jgi:tRNA dimethylallyltransferase
MEVARKTGAEILSADSMQVYRGMDIGTAKPTPEERAEVVHHLIDVVEPTESFTVARFVDLADQIIGEAQTPLIVVGGTPLYYQALFKGLFEGPAADEAIRKRLGETDVETLHARLMQIDPAAAARIHMNDRKRLVRALEVHELTGQPISSLQKEWGAEASQRHAAVWIGLDWDREVLNRRINARVKAMMEAGWLEEARALLARYGALSKTAAEATGYAELIAHLRGGEKLDDVVEQIKIATRQLARRQMKWFRRFRNVTWIAGDKALEEKVEIAMQAWRI